MNFLKIQKFLFSNKNIIGCSLAAIILVLAIFGIIKSWVLPIALMAYIFGYVAGPAEKQIKFYHFKKESYADYIGFINKMKNTVDESEKLPTESKKAINNIAQGGIELLAFIEKGETVYSLNEDLVNFTSIFDTYLPNVINQYERLPTRYATEVKSSNGSTAKEMLLEQLGVLNSKVEEIAHGMYENDVTALRVNGNFLKEKFGKHNLFELQTNTSITNNPSI